MLKFQDSFRCISESLDHVIKTTNRHTDMLKTLAYKSIDQEARSRRNNLIFWGLAENPRENCYDIIRDFIKNQMDLDAENMYIARAHRLGQRRTNTRMQRRPLIVNFRDYCDTESIMSKAFLLKGTPFSVDFDLPKEINEARKALWSELKQIKSRNPRAKVQIVYPAKLLVDGKVIRDQFPEWAAALKGDGLGDFEYVNESVLFERPDPRDFTHRSSTVEMPRDNPGNNEWGDVWGKDMSVCSEESLSDANGNSTSVCVENTLPHMGANNIPDDTRIECGPENRTPVRSNSPCNHDKSKDTNQNAQQLFRPFNTTGSEHINKTNSNISKDNQTSLSSEQERRSRPVQRGTQRTNSISQPRTSNQTQSDRRGTPLTDKNKQLQQGENQSSSESKHRTIGESEQINTENS